MINEEARAIFLTGDYNNDHSMLAHKLNTNEVFKEAVRMELSDVKTKLTNLELIEELQRESKENREFRVEVLLKFQALQNFNKNLVYGGIAAFSLISFLKDPIIQFFTK